MFCGAGTHLARYARNFPAVEINSSFHRPHRPGTYARWADCVPPAFRFAVKLPREITHRRKLVAADEPLDRFLHAARHLGDRLGPVLVQLPPGLAWDGASAGAFFAGLRQRFEGAVVCEPRHPSWFADPVDAVLSQFRVARVAADPARVPRAAVPGGWPGLIYRRLHGAPRLYHSPYAAAQLDAIARAIRAETIPGRESWCIFDNTAQHAATVDALGLMERLTKG